MNEVRPATVHEVELWRNTLEKNSLPDNEFLWHSLSALHLLHQGRGKGHHGVKRKAIEIAYQHHIRASSLFGSMTPEVTEHNWPVYLGFAISIIICQLAMQSICPAPVFDYIEMIQVLRASREIMYTMSGWLRASEMWPLIAERTKLTDSDMLHDYGLQDALTMLDIEVERATCISGHGDCMHVAMKQLKEWVELCEARPRRWGQYCSWPAVVPENFMDALRSGDHLALVLLLHWLAVIRLAPSRWFLEGWLIRTSYWVFRGYMCVFADPLLLLGTAEHILSQLPHEWDHLTAWPASILRTDRNGLLYVGYTGGPHGSDLDGDIYEHCFQLCSTDPAFGYRHG